MNPLSRISSLQILSNERDYDYKDEICNGQFSAGTAVRRGKRAQGFGCYSEAQLPGNPSNASFGLGGKSLLKRGF
ncbi:hypothetical protein PROFUN_09124 [Planoprotostelium fungivorum]|uniref:Uncharacterized protein n=1 Tax=Planoprotostelium fungivorum TaxID=1890364 RepID=A0A2P6NHY5_9EUKA|nr:hypothetical protein PROFUN_09124 [Planoprotostelium fungivorum]